MAGSGFPAGFAETGKVVYPTLEESDSGDDDQTSVGTQPLRSNDTAAASALSQKSEGKKGIFILARRSDMSGNKMKWLFGKMKSCSWLTSVPAFILTEELPSPEDMRNTLAAWPNVSIVDIRAKGLWDIPEMYKGIQYPHFKDHDYRNGDHDFTYGMPYRLMCDLWSTKIMHLAKDLGVDYYLRLDTDSLLTCDTSTPSTPSFAAKVDEEGTQHTFSVARDLFDVVKEGDHVYGYYRTMRDTPSVSEGFNHLVKAYAHEQGLDLHGKIGSQLMEEKDNKGSLQYYNNLEVVKVDYFLQPEVQKFTNHVAKSNGIYEYRWGDAIVRFWQVALFSKPKDVACFTSDMGVTYMHRNGKLQTTCSF
jgi:hypothetical protein